MTTLTLSHTPATGTLLDGTSKGDASADALRSVRHVAIWRWSRDLGMWYIRQSRDRRVRTYQLDETAKTLRAAGFDITIELSEERRPVAEQEADKAARAESRVARLEDRAATLQASGESGYGAAREYASRIPFGQPILVGHHSESRHRRDIEKINNAYDKAFSQMDQAEKDAERAKAAEAHQKHRAHGATTMRRLEKLQAERRKVQRSMDNRVVWATGDPMTEEQVTRKMAHYQPIADELDEKITYWTEYLRGLAEAGIYRVWTRADFAKGDFVRTRYGWSEVKRVNAKSLTIPHIMDELAVHGHTWSLPYDEVRGHRAASEHVTEVAQSA
jgi:hypothetical protein